MSIELFEFAVECKKQFVDIANGFSVMTRVFWPKKIPWGQFKKVTKVNSIMESLEFEFFSENKKKISTF